MHTVECEEYNGNEEKEKNFMSNKTNVVKIQKWIGKGLNFFFSNFLSKIYLVKYKVVLKCVEEERKDERTRVHWPHPGMYFCSTYDQFSITFFGQVLCVNIEAYLCPVRVELLSHRCIVQFTFSIRLKKKKFTTNWQILPHFAYRHRQCLWRPLPLVLVFFS